MFREDMTLYQTRDGGQTWSEIAKSADKQSFLPEGVKSGMVFTSETKGWITTNAPWQGTVGLYATQDGGTTWSKQAIAVPDSFQDALLFVYPPLFVTPKDGFLVTRPDSTRSLVFVTEDGGDHWKAIVDQPKGSFARCSWSLAEGVYAVQHDNQTWTLNTGGSGTWSQD